MEKFEIKDMLESLAAGSTTVDEAMLKLKKAPFEEIGIASLDLHRGLRQGTSEIVYGASKTPEQISLICKTLWKAGQRSILITRMKPEAAELMETEAAARAADAEQAEDIPPMTFTYYSEAKVGLVGTKQKPRKSGYILVATGGTSDIPVAEEAALTAEVLGNNVKRIYDVGVAGIHRLLAHTDDIMNARVIIAIAGMEGALASVIGGLADCPVIAVPTSVGYGTALGGVTALLSMLNSCASGVSVVNIDNGFGAGYQAHLINNMED